MSGRKKALILGGDGINCEMETADACRQVGFDAKIEHLNDLIAARISLDALSSEYSVVAIPGGFSFGDDLSSGKVLALKIRFGLNWDLAEYVHRGGLVIGICNGFQALLKMGIFGRSISITHNESGKFQNQWVKVEPSGTKCAWLKGMGTIDVPIRHAEGRVLIERTSRVEVLNKLERQGALCLRYIENPNGSDENVAGMCDPSGRIFGLMPHPEAFMRWTSHPEWTAQPDRAGSPGQGIVIFENAFEESRASS